MPFKTIRLTCAALAVLLALVCFARPCSAGQEDKQHIKPPLPFPQMYPYRAALELMQLAMDNALKKELEARIKAGEKIEYGGLKVTSLPEGAGVLVNSYIPLGKTPYANDKLLPGPHRVTVRKDGYYEQVRMVDIKANQTGEMEFELKPIPYARLTVKTSPPFTKVSILYIDKPYTPGMKLPPGEYLISMTNPRLGEKRLYAVLKPNQEITLKVDLARLLGIIKLDIDPPDATIFLDGRDVKDLVGIRTEPVAIPGLHKVQIWKSLFKPVTKIVQVKRLEETEVKVRLSPAEHFKNSLGMEFVKIPAGKFMMGFNGSPEYHASRILEMGNCRPGKLYLVCGWLYNMFPQHLVEISKSFYMQTTEVTNAQWDWVMGTSTPKNHAQHPKTGLNFDDAKKFIAKLNMLDKGHYRYRLPTEAEWEYAARAGSKGFFYCGDYITTDKANFDGYSSSQVGCRFGKSRINPIKVKSFTPNSWGLYDMHGNASELCSDWYDGFFYTYSPIKDPVCKAQGNGVYVSRGGSSLSSWYGCMSGHRGISGQRQLGGTDWAHGMRLAAEKLPHTP